MKARAAAWIATWFGCGYAPAAPGTAGSLAGLAIAWLLVRYAGWQPLWFLPLVLVAAVPGIWAADRTANALNQKDPGVVVVDVRVDRERLVELDLEDREVGLVDSDRDRAVLALEALAVTGPADDGVHEAIV